MLFLSQCIGRPVRDPADEPIGKVADLIVAIGDRYPPVTGLVVATDHRQIFLPWRSVERLDESGARLRVRTIDIGKFRQRPDEILLKGDLLDKQIVDIEGRKVIRVNDVSLDEIEGALHVVAVDVGAAGLLRRLGMERPWRTIARPSASASRSATSTGRTWILLDSTIASIRLRVPHSKLAQLHPADLASIVEQLAPRDRAGVLAALDDEAVADAMERWSRRPRSTSWRTWPRSGRPTSSRRCRPTMRRTSSRPRPGHPRRDPVPHGAGRGRGGAGAPRLSRGFAGGIMTTGFIALDERLTAAAGDRRLRELEPDAETIYYVYVTDDDGRLVGVLSLRDLIVALPNVQIGQLMIREPVAVGVLAGQDEVAEVVAHYNLLAVPVVDDERRAGRHRDRRRRDRHDHPTAWKKRLPRVFSR